MKASRVSSNKTEHSPFAFFKPSEDNTYGKHSQKVKVQYSILKADKQGSFVGTNDSCLLDL